MLGIVRCTLTIRFLYNKISARILLCIYAHDFLGIGFRELQRRIGQTNYNSYYYCISKLREHDVITTTPKDKKIHLTEKGRNFIIMGLIPTLLWQIDEQILNMNTTPRELAKKRNRYDNIRRKEDIEKQHRLIRLYNVILSSCALEHNGTPWIEEHDAEQITRYLDAINVKSIKELEKIGELRSDIGYPPATYTCYCNPEFPYIMMERKEIPILKWSHKYSSGSSPVDGPVTMVRYRFSLLGVSKQSLSSYRYPESLQSDIAFSQDEIEKALRSLELLHIIEPRLSLPDDQNLYFITNKYDQMVSFAHDCLSLSYIVTEMFEKLLISSENIRRKKLKNAAVNWFETSLGKEYSDKKLRELYYSLEATEIRHTNCRSNMNELIHKYYDAPKLYKSAREAIRYIRQKHKNILEEHSYLTEPMLNMAHYEPLLHAVSKISGISHGKCIKYPIQKLKERELKSKLYPGVKLIDAYQILAEEGIPIEHYNRMLFCNLGFRMSPIKDKSYQDFCLIST